MFRNLAGSKLGPKIGFRLMDKSYSGTEISFKQNLRLSIKTAISYIYLFIKQYYKKTPLRSISYVFFYVNFWIFSRSILMHNLFYMRVSLIFVVFSFFSRQLIYRPTFEFRVDFFLFNQIKKKKKKKEIFADRPIIYLGRNW